MAQCGFDWLAVDCEHGANDLVQSQVLFQAMRAGTPECVPFVRLPGNSYESTKRFLDAGAKGVIAPLVNSADDACEVIRSVKYYPKGERGVGISRAHAYGLDFDNYLARANTETIVVVRIEHIRAVERIDEILSTPGVDAAFLGPYDLTASLGVPRQFDHPDVRDAVKRILTACQEHAVAPGIHVVEPQPDEVKRRLDEGFRLIAYSLDILLLSGACRDGLQAISELIRGA